MIQVAIPTERKEEEKRVAASPETVKKLVELGYDVAIEKGAGEGASIADSTFEKAGAKICASESETLENADIVLKVQPPSYEEVALMKKGALLFGMLAPYGNRKLLDDLADAGINAFAMELMPRITRAQSMDVLSSQANLAGYRAVIDAAAHLNRVLPMMMTAAGTVPPTRVLVLGAGVAGLQAIATARRLGAVVCATDVRAVAKEQVESLGATFITVTCDAEDDPETSDGYAKKMDECYMTKQRQFIKDTLKTQDIVICTALIPGQLPPTLITDDMVKQMKPGSVIVDMAAEYGGNCTLSQPGDVVDVYGVKIVGYLDMPSRVAANASALYAKNLFNFVTSFVDIHTGEAQVAWEDEIVQKTVVTKDGAVMLSNKGVRN